MKSPSKTLRIAYMPAYVLASLCMISHASEQTTPLRTYPNQQQLQQCIRRVLVLPEARKQMLVLAQKLTQKPRTEPEEWNFLNEQGVSSPTLLQASLSDCLLPNSKGYSPRIS